LPAAPRPTSCFTKSRISSWRRRRGGCSSSSVSADRAQCLFGLAREREEAEASLLGILWEAALGQPALASLLDQNWLEGADRPSTAAHFTAVFERLLAGRHVDAEGVPLSQALS
jgi:hypothetical protein